ncbi:MAG: hypothetical protein DRN90_08145, partial [Thermoproteota archaeon]
QTREHRELAASFEKIRKIEEKRADRAAELDPEFYKSLLNVVEQMEMLAMSLTKKEGGERFIPILRKIRDVKEKIQSKLEYA